MTVASPSTARHAGIDVLKGGTTLLVVFHHTAITYGGPGGWFYNEVTPDGSWPFILLQIFCAVNQAWFMGLFFLLAGYFTPGALQRRGPAGYLRERFVRLGIPLLVFIAVLGPLTIGLAGLARGEPVGAAMLREWRSGHLETGPLWFAQALLMFAIGVVAVRAIVRPAAVGRAAEFPSNRELAFWAIACGAVAFAIRLVVPVGVNVFGLQLGYFASYLILFAAGCRGGQHRWLDRLPDAQVRTWRRTAWITLPLLLPLAVLSKVTPAFAGSPLGGLNLPSLMYAFWEPFVAWGLILALLWRATHRATPPGPWMTALGRRAFAIYVIHPLAVVGVAIAWRDVAWHPLVKFAITGSVACVLCFWVAGWLLRLPGIRRVL